METSKSTLSPDELIKEQRKQIEELQKKLSGVMPEADKLKGILSMFETMPELGKLEKTAKDLEAFAKSFEPLIKIIEKLPKKTLEQMKKAK